MDYTNKKILEKLENDSLEPQDLGANSKPLSPKKKKKSSNAEFKQKYFEYYDDVKTNIKEDW